ncbi:hypothetical protein MYP_4020 [Sporocytophaga myxococcoides]|uniref:Uncharacterized protein n=1 Tax=Sporocytophaga myxococcoides TaxID=153721 RepID=A0A098LIM5_9BACT|nr:gliding motility-associated C-terminal domain-containing protein [Sporocytophaga myxococcoides]GAL86790.1 hypothetical protein MYP_4020 [Sporocytophaga myxococcoides]
MKEGVEYYFEIDQYLSGELSNDALLKFEKALAEDPALRDEVANQKLLNKIVLGAELDILRDRIKKDINNLDQKNNIKKWLLGGSILLLIGAATIFGISSNNESEKPRSVNSVAETQFVQKADPSQNNEIPIDPKTKKPVNKEVWKNPQIRNSSESLIDTVPLEIKNEIILQKETVTITSDSLAILATLDKKSDACADVNIIFKLTSASSCIDGATGEVKVEEKSLKGGTGPYFFELNGSGNFSSESSYSNLRPGSYTVKVRDQSGCLKEKSIQVSAKECYKKQSFSFSPELGETLKISVSSEEPGILSIYNRAGLLIFKTKTGQGEIVEWTGTDMTGNLALAGLYVYIVEYANGGKENGQITVLK